ncbi:MAG: NADH-ubiquinone oxidoreductase [Planctomycetaceae bacterium]|nr:NADH-ubiquinone oxidoreductase [Planctomycetaceae bacterium]
MNAALFLLAVLSPIVVAVLSAFPSIRKVTDSIAPWTAAMAFGATFGVRPEVTIDLPWLMLGARVGLDVTGQLFLAFTSLLWLLAGVYARSYLRNDAGRHRFFAFYLVAMAGNFGLILAHDLLTFVAFFAMMSFSAYGLITHDRHAESWRAGRTYIILVVLGEVLLFAGLVLAALQADSLLFEDVRAVIALSSARDVIVALLLVGFGIKLGVVPLHFWLPLAHPVAPTPASAVLSGAMIKAGLLGWMRFLPLGEAVMPNWGALCIVVGFMAAFYGVIVGLTHINAKTVLAYSSVSQMGLVVVAVGSAFTGPTAWPTVSAALAVFALHHAISKGALFLGVGVADGKFDASWKRWLVCVGLMLPALALAGAPFTLGGAAKVALNQATTSGVTPWAELCEVSLPISSIATTLLMARFLFLVWPHPREEHHKLSPGMWLPWSLLVTGVVGMTWALYWHGALDPYWFKTTPASLWKNTWPIAAGTGLAVFVLCNERLSAWLSRLYFPAGDVVVPIAAMWLRLVMFWNRRLLNPLAHCSSLVSSWWSATDAPNVTLPFSRLSLLESWGAVGLLVMLLAAALFVLLVL